jgi:Guanyl-specific ribonuclease Sa
VRRTTQRTLLMLALIAAATLVVWLLVRAPGAGTAERDSAQVPSRSVTATSGGDGAQRHTATNEPDDSATDPVSGLPWVAESALPPEARDTLALIEAGGPFPYPRNDNQTFFNREGLLPREGRGYYREFTVETPGSDDRGPRRIITGAGGEKYWTADHYDSFSRIREGT